MTPPVAPPVLPREPVFNLPPVVVAVLGVLVLVHMARMFALSPAADEWVLLTFAFFPARIGGDIGIPFPGGVASEVWSFITYALLHADLTHLVVNSVWLAAFGSPLASRLGAGRFLVFSVGAAAAGAVAHLIAHPGELIPMVGASAAISGHMAAICRFAFDGRARLLPGGEQIQRPARPLAEALRDRRVLGFLAAWFAINLFFGLTNAAGAVQSGALAWEAHIGGFVFGLLAFRLFDPYRGPAIDRSAP